MAKTFLQKAKRSETRPCMAQTQNVFNDMLQQAIKRFFASDLLTPFFNKAGFIVGFFLLNA